MNITDFSPHTGQRRCCDAGQSPDSEPVWRVSIPAAGPLCPAVTSCQLSGGGAAAVRPQRSTSPAPTSRPAKQPGSESESCSRLPTIGSRSFAVIVGNFHNSSTLLFLPPTIWVSASEPSIRAANDPSVFIITEKAPTMAFSWLIAPTSIFTFNTQLTLYAKQACTPQ